MSLRHVVATALVALALGVVSAISAKAAEAPAFHVVGTPQLFAVVHPAQGRPSAYVVFAGDRRLHEPRSVVVRVAGHSGRTYVWSRTRCFRSAFVSETAAGTPLPIVKAGHRYTVTFAVRPGASGPKTTIATRRLVARPWRPGARGIAAPRCAGAA